MKSSYVFIIFSFIFLLCSCASDPRGLSELFDAKETMDQIPDEFENKSKIKEKFFRDKTNDYGLSNIVANNINIVDLNGDGYSDIVVIPSYYGIPEFYYYVPSENKFVKGFSPFVVTPRVSFLLFYDVNGDRVLDVISAVLNQESELSREPIRVYLGKLKNNVLKFEEDFVFPTSSANATLNLIDYNLDGRLDLFVGNWFKKESFGPIPVPDQLYLNQYQLKNDKKEKFFETSQFLQEEEKKNSSGMMYVNASPTYGAQVCDVDQNGYPDIITTSSSKYANKLWMNKYKFRDMYRYFQDYAVDSGVAGDPEGLLNTQGNGRTFAVACADYNNDTIMDIFLGELSHNFDNEGVDKSSLLTGRSLKFPPKFYRTEYFVDGDDPSWHQADRRAIWVDLNNDGLLDLLVDNSGYPPFTRMIIFMQMPDHSFTNKAEEFGLDLLNPMSSVVADFNQDGRMDILTAQSNIRDDSVQTKLILYENNLLTDGNRSLRVYPRGQRSNIHGLNATVMLKVKNKEGEISQRMQTVSYSYGPLPPQNEEGIHFGLEKGEKIISLTVRWPYAEVLDTVRTNLEKTYLISDDFESHLQITLCEDGTHIMGQKECKIF